MCVCVCARRSPDRSTHQPPPPVPRRLHCSLTTWGTFISLSNASQFRFLSNDWIRVCVPLNTSITYTHTHVKADALESLERIYIQLMKWIRFWSFNPSFKAHTFQRPHHTTWSALTRPTFIFLGGCHRICHHHQHQHEYHTWHYGACVCWVEREIWRACEQYWQWNGETVHKKGVDTFWICRVNMWSHSPHSQSAYMHKINPIN